MPVSKAQLKAKAKYEKKAYWKPTIYFPREMENEIKSLSAETSVNSFVIQAVKEKIARMKLDEERKD